MANLRIDKDIDNSALNELLAQRAVLDKNDKKAMGELSARLAAEIVMKARFLAVVSFNKELAADENGDPVMQDGTNMNFILLDSSDSGKYFPVFTDKSAIDKWGGVKDYHTVQIAFDNLANLILTGSSCNGMVVNVGTDNLVIERSVIAGWNERKQIAEKGHADGVITGNTPYEIYPANPYPLQLSNKLCEAAKGIKGVNNLWLRGITLNGEVGYLLVVDFTGERQATFSKLGEAGKEFLGRMPLHLVPFNDELGRNAVDKVVPIYSKAAPHN